MTNDSPNPELKSFESLYFAAVQALLKIADSMPLDAFRAACEETIEIKQVEEKAHHHGAPTAQEVAAGFDAAIANLKK